MKKILRWFALFAGFMLLAAASGVAWKYFYRPGLEEYAAHRYVPPVPGGSVLTATWLGTTAVLLSDGEHSLLVDPFFTRPQGWLRLFGNREIAPDEETIARGLSKARLANLAAVLVSHSHFDHAMDAAVVARLSGAVLVGSASTAHIGRGGGLPDAQIRVIQNDAGMGFGSFTVSFIPGQHAGATGGRPTGEISAPLKPPARYLDYKQGGTYSILVEHALGAVLLHGSAGFVPGALQNREADVVFLGIALREGLETYLAHTVDAVGARRVIPTHWDDFTRPSSKPLIPNIVGVNLRGFFRDMARRPDLQVQTLEFGEPAVLFTR